MKNSLQKAESAPSGSSSGNNAPPNNYLLFGVAGGMIGAMFSFTLARFPDLMELLGVPVLSTSRRLTPTLGCLFLAELLVGILVGGIVGGLFWRGNIRQERDPARIVAFLFGSGTCRFCLQQLC